MAVDMNFASLFEKLKLEEPWLPPRHWESIPSESGHFRSAASTSNSSASPSLYGTPIISETSLVRLAVNALQGIESALITIENLCAAFYCDPADRTFHQIPSLWNRSSSTLALGKILESIGRSGCVMLLLRKLLDHFSNSNLDEVVNCNKVENLQAEENHNDHDCQGVKNHQSSLVNQAFSVALRKVLEGYICAVDTIYASVGLRRSSNTVAMSSHPRTVVGCLASSVHSEVTLLEVYLHTRELRTQIEALGNICNICDAALCFPLSSFGSIIAKANIAFCNFPRGGDLLTYLYRQLKFAEPVHSALLKFLFLCSFEPYCEFVRSWIYRAKIIDPYKEFVVAYIDNSPCYSPGVAGSSSAIPLATIREQDGIAVPCFLKDFSIPLLRAGQQLQVLMKLLELFSHVGTGNHACEDILPCWSDFSTGYPSFASQLSFNKTNIEALVLARNNYYKKMLEKLDISLTKLDIRYEQVVPHGNIPVSVNNSEGKLSMPLSSTEDDSFTSLSAEKRTLHVFRRAVDTMESEASGTVEEFSHVEDQSESSECSSLDGSEEQNESVKLIQNPNSLVAFESNYLSALNLLSTSTVDHSFQKPSERDASDQVDGKLSVIYERTDLHDSFFCPSHTETYLRKNPLCLESGKPNWPWLSGNQCADSRCDTDWPISCPAKNPFHVERSVHDASFYPSECGFKVSTRNTGAPKEGSPYSSNVFLSEISLTEETNDRDQLSNITCSSSYPFHMRPLNLKYHSNLLSLNPMLSKNDLMRNNGERWGADHIEPFPCFDFASVEDPCKAYVRNVAANPRCQSGAVSTIFDNSNASPAISSANYQNKGVYGGYEILNDKTPCHVNFMLKPKKDKNENGILANVTGGSGWQNMLSFPVNMINPSARCRRETLTSEYDMPLDYAIEKCLLQEILLQYWYVSKLAIRLLEKGFNLQEHFLALRRYHFMELADWADLFITSLWHHKWYAAEADLKVSEIQGLLEMSVQRSSCERDHHKDRLFVYMKGKGKSMVLLSTSTIGVDSFDFLGLGYRVDWPVSIVLTPGSLKKYAQIFSFLIRVKLAFFSLTDIWCSLKDLLPSINHNHHSVLCEPEVRHFNTLVSVRHQVNHFVSTLQQYVQSQLSYVSWFRFLDCLKHEVKDMMDLESVHMAYLTDSLDICFLSDDMKSSAILIYNIFQCALDFRSCLIRPTCEPGLDGGSSGRVSLINISQVLAIKQTFHKNLSDLHLCYLKTPKHREFGLSHFWGYLNYNEYYSDISDDASHHGFRV